MKDITFKITSTLMLFISLQGNVFSQDKYADFSFWSWLQLSTKISKNQYIGFQYQARFNNNASTFNRSNIYFDYKIKLIKNLTGELLYQLNTNRNADQHTFYVGAIYKLNASPKLSFHIRTAIQQNRNYFTGDYATDNPYNEWRNRVRAVYKFNQHYRVALSAEPYLMLKNTKPIYLSRMRYVSQFTINYNKYHSLTLFYLIQPDYITFSKPKISYVAGVAYQITIPSSRKGFRKFLNSTLFKKVDYNEEYNTDNVEISN